MADEPDLNPTTTDILGRADAFMRRRRNVPTATDEDIPLLTDIVPLANSLPIPQEIPEPAVFQLARRGTEAARIPAPILEPVLEPLLEPVLEPVFEPALELGALTEPAPGFPQSLDESSLPPFGPAAISAFDLAFEAEPIAPFPAADPQLVTAPEASPETVAAPVVPPDPALIEELVAIRLTEALAEYRQDIAVQVEDWLNFDLPRLIARETAELTERITQKAAQELRILLQTRYKD